MHGLLKRYCRVRKPVLTWLERTAKRWINAWDNGSYIHHAWNKIPLCPGAKKIADIRLTQKPYPEPLAVMPLSDLEAEGGLWESREEFISLFGGNLELLLWVVRFELVTTTNLNVHFVNI